MTKINLKLILVHLEIVLILTQDRCTICAERAIESKIVLDAPNETPRCRGSCGISFGPFEMLLVLVKDRCTVCAKHTIGLDIILDTPDGTPK